MIGIVLLNYNNWKLTSDCIDSIEKTTLCEYRVYVVDNASKEKPAQEIIANIENRKKVTIIYNKINAGYAAGNNIGIAEALADGCEEILISNNDVIFSQSCIDKLKVFLQQNKDVAVVGPKVFLPSGALQEINMGCKMTLKGKYLYLLRKTPLKFFSKSFVYKFHAEDKDHTKPFYVHGVSGCCFMISPLYVNYLYPFDDHTFLYEEENILACKIEAIKKKVVYFTDASIIHLGGESTKGMSEFAYSCQVESELYYCGKCLNSNRLALLIFIAIRTLLYLRYFGTGNINKYFKRLRKMYRLIYV